MLDRRWLIAAVVTAVSMPGFASDPPKASNPAEAAAIGLLDMAFNQRKVAEAFGKYVGPYYRQHNPQVADGKQAAIESLPKFLAAAPQMRYDIKRVISEGDLVVVHSHVTVKPSDPGMAVVDIFRVENGKVVEHWDVVQSVPEKAANDNTMF